MPKSQMSRPINQNQPIMNLIERAKNIITAPNKEWDVVNGEEPNIPGIITGYVLPIAGAAAVAGFIGWAFVGTNVLGFRFKGMDWGLYQGIAILVSALISVFVASFVIDALAPSFASEKNMGRSFQLVSYSFTPYWVGLLLGIIPSLAIIGSLAGLYGLYLMYLGIPKLKKTPADKHVSYFVVSLIVMIVVQVIIGLIMSRILMSVFGLSFNYGGGSFNL